MNRLQRLALLLATSPMVLGGLVLGLWLATQWQWLMGVGLAVVGCGLACVLVVPVLLLVGGRMRSADGLPPCGLWSANGMVLLVLALNVPAYFGVMVVAAWRFSRFTVQFVNEADTAWHGLSLEGGGVQLPVADVPPATTHTLHVWFEHDGELRLRHGGAAPIVVEGYVTNGMGGTATATRRVDGSVLVQSSMR